MRVRRTVLLLVLLVSTALPASAFADVPVNDTQAGATAPEAVLDPAYAASQPFTKTINPVGPAPTGGWTDATNNEDALKPSCLGYAPKQSMWYSIKVTEASVLTVKLRSGDVGRYQPVVTIFKLADQGEMACGLGGTDGRTDPTASATSFVAADTYLVLIGSVQTPAGLPAEGPSLTLTESLQDVTPPKILVNVSAQAKIVGPNKAYTFDASASSDQGAGLDLKSASWQFFEDATPPPAVGGGSLVVRHAWKTAGVHQVTMMLKDKAGNLNTYTFTVLVHNFVPPTVGLRVFVPSPGTRQLRLVLTHDVPVRLDLVIMQNGRLLRSIPSKLVRGSRVKTTIKVALRRKVGKVGFVAVSGVASDLGEFPNTVPLLTCSVDPVNGGGVCA